MKFFEWSVRLIKRRFTHDAEFFKASACADQRKLDAAVKARAELLFHAHSGMEDTDRRSRVKRLAELDGIIEKYTDRVRDDFKCYEDCCDKSRKKVGAQAA